MTIKPSPRPENWTLEMVLAATGGQVIQRGGAEFTAISTDTRTLMPGSLFVALEGERFDGHDFLAEALARGAAGALVRAGRAEKLHQPASLVAVADTLRALGNLAGYWRRLHPVTLVAITGSNGKTATKEMAAAILARQQRVLKNPGNLNNLVGVPLTLLQLRPEHQVAVLELGMNRPGEIARLVEIAAPDVGLITNIQPAHLEGLGSLEGVQTAKGELFSGLEPTATIVVNLDDPRVVELARSFPGRQVTYSAAGAAADVRVTRVVEMTVAGTRFHLQVGNDVYEVHIGVMGRHQLANGVAAAAVAWALGVDPAEAVAALDEVTPFDRRMEVIHLPGDFHLINDTYNANPASVLAAVNTLTAILGAGRALVVLGDMLELGADSATLHRQVGHQIGLCGVDWLCALGSQAPYVLAGAAAAGMAAARLHLATDHQDAASSLCQRLQAGDWVLVKGSRGMQMEKVVEKVVATIQTGQEPGRSHGSRSPQPRSR